MNGKYNTHPEQKGYSYRLGAFNVEGIPDNTVPTALFKTIERALMGGLKMEFFDNGRNIGDGIYTKHLLVEYQSDEEREKDIEGNTKLELENPFKSKVLGKGRQVVETVGYFDYNGKHYLVGYVRNRKTEEINPDIGVYKGIVVNHSSYNSSKIGEDEGVKSQVNTALGKTEGMSE